MCVEKAEGVLLCTILRRHLGTLYLFPLLVHTTSSRSTTLTQHGSIQGILLGVLKAILSVSAATIFHVLILGP